MTYRQLIETVSEIVENENIHKEGLILTYTLSEANHKKMDEHLFHQSNPDGRDYEYNDIIEIEIGGIEIKIFKKN